MLYKTHALYIVKCYQLINISEHPRVFSSIHDGILTPTVDDNFHQTRLAILSQLKVEFGDILWCGEIKEVDFEGFFNQRMSLVLTIPF